MKLFIALCATIALVAAEWAPITTKDYLRYRDECLKSENVPQAVIEKLNNHQYEEDLGHEAKCYIRCLAVKSGTWDDTNGYNLERSYENLISNGFEATKENLKKCMTTSSGNEDKCVWATKDLKCMWRNKYITKKQ